LAWLSFCLAQAIAWWLVILPGDDLAIYLFTPLL